MAMYTLRPVTTVILTLHSSSSQLLSDLHIHKAKAKWMQSVSTISMLFSAHTRGERDSDFWRLLNDKSQDFQTNLLHIQTYGSEYTRGKTSCRKWILWFGLFKPPPDVIYRIWIDSNCLLPCVRSKRLHSDSIWFVSPGVHGLWYKTVRTVDKLQCHMESVYFYSTDKFLHSKNIRVYTCAKNVLDVI